MMIHNLVYFGKQVILRNARWNSLDDINGPSREAALCVVAQDHVSERPWSKFCTDLERSTTDDRVFKSYLRIFCMYGRSCVHEGPAVNSSHIHGATLNV